MNTLLRKYHGATNFFVQLFLAIALVVCAIFFAIGGAYVQAALILTVGSWALNKNRPGQFYAVTLSVPEILADVLDAFKLETPELFGPNGFGHEFKSDKAVLGETVKAKISHVPIVGDYDRAAGGFKNATQDVTGLIEDVPCTMDQFKVVVINVNYITQLASQVQLYQEAIRNFGYALGKYVIDYALTKVTPANFSNEVVVPLANMNLDTIDINVREQLNLQKAYSRGRFCLLNTPAASKFGSDDRVRSALYYNDRQQDEGFRKWKSIGGFNWLREYTDLYAANNMIGFAGDHRSLSVVTRGIDFGNAAKQLGIPEVMSFYPMTDPETGISMTGVGWQEAGTGDVYVGAGILFGVSAGCQGGAAGTITDNAGVRIVTAAT